MHPRESCEVLAKFQQIYDIETRGKKRSADHRWTWRQSEAKPIWESLGVWLDSPAARALLPKSKFGESLGYVRNHWEPLPLYLTDGRMLIDNNDVEQWMKQIALGRKNWLFTSSVAAGEGVLLGLRSSVNQIKPKYAAVFNLPHPQDSVISL